MTQYVKITKLIQSSDDANLLELGKVYKVSGEFFGGVLIHVNKKHPEYYVTESQYKLVEKEVTTDDLKAAMLSKAEDYEAEAKHLLAKKKRLEEQSNRLFTKAVKLRIAVETVEEFEGGISNEV